MSACKRHTHLVNINHDARDAPDGGGAPEATAVSMDGADSVVALVGDSPGEAKECARYHHPQIRGSDTLFIRISVILQRLEVDISKTDREEIA